MSRKFQKCNLANTDSPWDYSRKIKTEREKSFKKTFNVCSAINSCEQKMHATNGNSFFYLWDGSIQWRVQVDTIDHWMIFFYDGVHVCQLYSWSYVSYVCQTCSVHLLLMYFNIHIIVWLKIKIFFPSLSASLSGVYMPVDSTICYGF